MKRKFIAVMTIAAVAAGSACVPVSAHHGEGHHNENCGYSHHSYERCVFNEYGQCVNYAHEHCIYR